jgi:hypothetical protein
MPMAMSQLRGGGCSSPTLAQPSTAKEHTTMSTRARIAIRQADGAYRSIYCHSNGYPTGVGKTLADHYAHPEKVEQLIGLGNLSSLGVEIGEQHPFEDRDEAHANWCIAYARDRGERDMEAMAAHDFDALLTLTQNCGGEYLYIYVDGVWLGYDEEGWPLDTGADPLTDSEGHAS